MFVERLIYSHTIQFVNTFVIFDRDNRTRRDYVCKTIAVIM